MNESTGGGSIRSGVQSIDRAVAILRCFDAHNSELGITQIARMTGLSTSTTHRLVVALQAHRLVRETGNRRYGLGPLIVQLAHSGAAPTGLRDNALPLMTMLRDEVDETVGLHELLPSEERAVIAQVESHHELRRSYTDLGIGIGLVYGAPGKAILCMLPVERQEWHLAQPIKAVTPSTITDPDGLRRQLAEARALGWTRSIAERTAGIWTVAAPLFDHSNEVVGALSVSVPEVRMSDARANELGRRVAQVAREISERSGATPEGIEQAMARAGGRETLEQSWKFPTVPFPQPPTRST